MRPSSMLRMLATQGDGIPETTVSFLGQLGHVSVAVPTNVVFGLERWRVVWDRNRYARGVVDLLLCVGIPSTAVPVLQNASLDAPTLSTWSLTALSVRRRVFRKL